MLLILYTYIINTSVVIVNYQSSDIEYSKFSIIHTGLHDVISLVISNILY